MPVKSSDIGPQTRAATVFLTFGGGIFFAFFLAKSCGNLTPASKVFFGKKIS
jgi:hypothetical protein